MTLQNNVIEGSCIFMSGSSSWYTIFGGHTIVYIIFWDFLIIEQIFLLLQVKRSVIISNELVYMSLQPTEDFENVKTS